MKFLQLTSYPSSSPSNEPDLSAVVCQRASFRCFPKLVAGKWLYGVQRWSCGYHVKNPNTSNRCQPTYPLHNIDSYPTRLASPRLDQNSAIIAFILNKLLHSAAAAHTWTKITKFFPTKSANCIHDWVK